MQQLARVGVLLVLAALTTGVGCAGSQPRQDDQQVQGEPPEQEPSEKLPEGPPVKVEDEMPEEAETDDSSSEKTSTRPVQEDGETISQKIRRRLLEKGPSYLFQVVQLEPAKKDGEFRGYEIAGVKPEVEEALAPQIEVGDIVVRANGVAIERPDDYMKAWEKFAEGGDIRVELLRDGKQKEATWVVESNNSSQK